MELNEKIDVFEYSIGTMALSYQILKSNIATKLLVKELDSIRTSEERVEEMLTKFNQTNDFSKIKAFGLFYRLMKQRDPNPDKWNKLAANFLFATVNYYRRIEPELYALYNNQNSLTEHNLRLSDIKCTIDEQGVKNLLMLKGHYENVSVLEETKEYIDNWISQSSNLLNLFRRDSDFQRRRYNLSYLVYDVS